MHLDRDLVPVDDPVRLELDGDGAGRAGEDTEGGKEETGCTITW